MKAFLFTATILGLVLSLVTTLAAIVACLSMGANSSPAEIRMLKFWMLGFTGLYGAALGTGILLLRRHRPGWAAGTSAVPMVVIGCVTVVTLLK